MVRSGCGGLTSLPARAAAEFARDLQGREDAGELAMTLERAAETARDVRGEVEGLKL